MKGSGQHLGRTQDENVDEALTTAGKIFVLAIATAVIVVSTAVISLIGVFAGLQQAEQNQLHTDCLLALVAHEPPKACAGTLRQLQGDGFIGPIGPDGDRNPHNDTKAIVESNAAAQKRSQAFHERSEAYHDRHDKQHAERNARRRGG